MDQNNQSPAFGVLTSNASITLSSIKQTKKDGRECELAGPENPVPTHNCRPFGLCHPPWLARGSKNIKSSHPAVKLPKPAFGRLVFVGLLRVATQFLPPRCSIKSQPAIKLWKPASGRLIMDKLFLRGRSGILPTSRL